MPYIVLPNQFSYAKKKSLIIKRSNYSCVNTCVKISLDRLSVYYTLIIFPKTSLTGQQFQHEKITLK